MEKHILVVDDEQDIRQSLEGVLGDEGFRVSLARNGPEALALVEDQLPDLVLLDIWMDGSEQGLEILEKLQREYPYLPVIMISGHGNIETAVRATKLGAYDYIEKPLSYDKILLVINHCLSYHRLAEEVSLLRRQAAKRQTLTGQSPVMTALMQQIRQVAPSNASVLITGANGTGKELVARTLHRLSRRADRPLVEVNCAAIPEELIESELFGHEKGAFTGADRTKRGRFELADGGTLFLDEIGDMSLKTQSKILRILQEQQFQRVGGAKTFSVDVRIIAATNKNLEEEIARGVFREDLFYRLNVIPLHVPLLKDRREDIPPLIEEFLAEFSTENNTEPKTIAPEAMASLAARDWPGNVRELRNAIERLVIMTPGPVIASVDLDRGPASPAALPQGLAGVLAAPSLKEARAEAERAYLRAKLAEHQGNVTQTAEAIGLDRTSLHKKIRALGLGVSGE